MVAGPKSSTGKRMYRCAAGQTLHRGPKCKRPAGMVADRLEEYVRENVRPVLEGLSISVSDADEALAEAERELQDAEHELEAFASDLTARRTLGDSYHRHLTERHDAVEAARHTYGELAREAQTQHRVTSTDILEGDDPRLMAELLGGILAISVTPGRGSVEDRVRLAPLHGDAAAGE